MALVVDVLARPGRLTRLALDPLPDLRVVAVRGVNDEVLVNGLGDGSLDLLTGGLIREGGSRNRPVLIDNHAAFLGDGLESESGVCDWHLQVFTAVVPAKLLDEQGLEGKVLQVFPDPWSVEGYRHVSFRPVQ